MADEATIGSVGVEVVPNAQDFWEKFKAATSGSATPTGADLGDDLGKAIGDVAGPEARDRIEAALKDLHGDVELDTAAASAKIEELQAQVDRLNNGGRGGGGGGRPDIGGIGAGAEGAGLSISQFLIPAIAAAATLIGPLAAVGAGAFGTILLGAKGLEDQIKTGLTPAFTQLEAKATDALTPGISAGIEQLQQAIPQLTPLVEIFGAAIGTEAAKLSTYLNNGGLQSFTTYAERELPIVESAFESLTIAGVKFFNAITPLGNVLLGVFTKLGDAISFISDKFDAFGSGATGTPSSSSANGQGFSAFGGGPDRTLNAAGQLWRDINVTGPNAGASGISSGLSYLGNQISNPPKSSFGVPSGWPSSVGSSVGSFFSHEFVNNFDAPTLNSQALQRATNNVVAPSLNSQALEQATNSLGAPSLNSKALSNATAGYGDPAIGNAEQMAKLYTSLGTTATAYATAKTQADAFTASQAASTLQMQLENNATGLLSQALSGLGGDTLGLAQANTQFQQGMLTLQTTLKSNHDVVTGNSAAALANQAALQQQVAAAQQLFQATAQQTGSTDQATAAYNQAITTLENQTGATGVAKDKIDAYIKSIDAIPALKETQLDINASVAVTAANLGQSVHDAVNNIPSSKAPAHAAGGPLSEGWNTAGEAGIEWLYKSGSDVTVYNQSQTAGMPAQGSQPIYLSGDVYLNQQKVGTIQQEWQMGQARR